MAELALVICVLLLVVLGIVDFGKAMNFWNDETHVANEAARYAAVGNLPSSGACGTNNSAVTDLVSYIKCEAGVDSSELANGGGSNGSQGPVTVCVSIPSAAVGQPVTVKLTTNYKWLQLPVLGGALQWANTNISGTATMRLEQVPPSGWATTTAACS
jgi:Flp pilus assembly protein TadG